MRVSSWAFFFFLSFPPLILERRYYPNPSKTSPQAPHCACTTFLSNESHAALTQTRPVLPRLPTAATGHRPGITTDPRSQSACTICRQLSQEAPTTFLVVLQRAFVALVQVLGVFLIFARCEYLNCPSLLPAFPGNDDDVLAWTNAPVLAVPSRPSMAITTSQ